MRFMAWLLFLFFSAPAAFAQEQKPPATLTELQQRLVAITGQPKYAAALWGVKIVSLDTGKLLFESNPQKLFSPASNSKLYTVAMALERLGPDYWIKTSLYSQAPPNQRGTLHGDLIVYGRGDPTLNARLHGSNVLNALEPLVMALTNAGVKRISGDLVADASYFRGPECGSGWVWEDLDYYYGAEISALTIDDNTVLMNVSPGDREGAPCKVTSSQPDPFVVFSNRTVTVEKGGRSSIRFHRPLDSDIVYVTGQLPLGGAAVAQDVPHPNPAARFLKLFHLALNRHGIRLGGKLRTVSWLDRQPIPLNCSNLVELGSVESLPMRELAREVFKPSQNLYTDLLLAHVGEKFRMNEDRPDATSEELGIRELNRFLADAGVDRGEVIFEEGSGLSRDNLTTPNATVSLLQYVNRRSYARDYLEALPIAGVDGTLRNRMRGTAAAGNVRAKTGTLRWANSLSGYVTTAAGEHLVFSLMLNRFRAAGGSSARADLDAVAVLLASFTGRSAD